MRSSCRLIVDRQARDPAPCQVRLAIDNQARWCTSRAPGTRLEAAWALHEGEWVGWIASAPDAVNRPFAELYADGLPPLTPLVVCSERPPPATEPGGGN